MTSHSVVSSLMVNVGACLRGPIRSGGIGTLPSVCRFVLRLLQYCITASAVVTDAWLKALSPLLGHRYRLK